MMRRMDMANQINRPYICRREPAMTASSTLALARYDFDLTESEKARAAALHRGSIVFDRLQQEIGGPRIFEHFPSQLRRQLDTFMQRLPEGFKSYSAVKFWPHRIAMEGRCHLIHEW
jgi:hypothetical protein